MLHSGAGHIVFCLEPKQITVSRLVLEVKTPKLPDVTTVDCLCPKQMVLVRLGRRITIGCMMGTLLHLSFDYCDISVL